MLKFMFLGYWFAVALFWATNCPAQDSSRRCEDFSSDPHWEGYRNRLLPNPLPITRQDFGWCETLRPDGQRGEIGGWIQRSLTPAWFAKVIPPRRLNDKLTASGTFVVSRDEGGSGMLLGWCNGTSRGWCTPNSLVFQLDGNGGNYWVFYEYSTRHWLTGGGGCTEGSRYQTNPTKSFRADGTSHAWSLTYDPEGANGDGLMTFVLDGAAYSCALAPGYRADGAEFNRFGLLNLQITGSGLEASFRDLTLDGRPIDLTTSGGWEARGNQVEFRDRQMRPFHDFGRIPAGEAVKGVSNGAVGGIIWRDEKSAYYASNGGPFTLNNELYAAGKIVFSGTGSNSGVYLGWFNSNSKTNKRSSNAEAAQTNLLAILVEGPSRVGHYCRAAYRTTDG